MSTRLEVLKDYQEAVELLNDKAGRIYYVEKGDSEIYEWDVTEAFQDLQEAEIIFIVRYE